MRYEIYATPKWMMDNSMIEFRHFVCVDIYDTIYKTGYGFFIETLGM